MNFSPSRSEQIDGPTNDHLALIAAASRLQVAFDEALSAALPVAGFSDLRPHWALAMTQLEGHPSPVSQLSLWVPVGQNPAYAKRKLVAYGYLNEVPHGSDARVRLLSLTERGEAAVRFVNWLIADFAIVHEFATGDDGNAIAQVVALLGRCEHGWQARRAQPNARGLGR